MVNNPNIRFAGFSDEWEERKLGEIAQINKGSQRGKQEIASVRTELNPYPVYNGGKNPSGYTDECNRVNNVMVSEGGASAGYVNYYSGKYWSGGHNFTISNDAKHDMFFLLYLLQESQEKLYKLQIGTGLPNIQLKSIKDFPIYTTALKEQQKIGSIFSTLDHKIGLEERQIALLKEQKKGYLQKMFPKNGAKVPELRFAGFVDDWEERKLKDLFIKGGSGGTPKSTNKDFYDGDIPFLGISDITKSNGFINNTEKHISLDGLNSSSAWIVPQGAISLAMYASVGKLAILNIDAATSQAFYNMIFDDYDLRDLVYQRLNKANESSEWNKLISTGTQSNLNADKVKNFQMILPKNHDEIKLLGSFFKQLDDTISLHQRKLELLKDLKKGLSQQMFV